VNRNSLCRRPTQSEVFRTAVRTTMQPHLCTRRMSHQRVQLRCRGGQTHIAIDGDALPRPFLDVACLLHLFQEGQKPTDTHAGRSFALPASLVVAVGVSVAMKTSSLPWKQGPVAPVWDSAAAAGDASSALRSYSVRSSAQYAAMWIKRERETLNANTR
jgi:hypothetical protein